MSCSNGYLILGVALLALGFGAGNSFTTKLLFQSRCATACSADGSVDRPIFATLIAFLGMAASGFLYLPGILQRLSRQHRISDGDGRLLQNDDIIDAEPLVEDQQQPSHGLTDGAQPAPKRKPYAAALQAYRPLALPAMLDVSATLLQIWAAVYIPAGVIATTRGSLLLCTAAMNIVLGVRDGGASRSEWGAILVSMAGVTIVGASALLTSSGDGGSDGGGSSFGLTALGIGLAASSNIVQAVQVAYETRYLEGARFTPVEVNTVEGIFGAIACLLLLGSFQALPSRWRVEDSASTGCCLAESPTLGVMSLVLWFLFAGSTLAHMHLSLLRGSNFRAFILVSRAVLVWLLELATFYALDQARSASTTPYGEPWGSWSWLQGVGFAVLAAGGVMQFVAQSAREALQREEGAAALGATGKRALEGAPMPLLELELEAREFETGRLEELGR